MSKKNSKTVLRILSLSIVTLILTASANINLNVAKIEPRFYLSNYTTFSPGDEVRINLYLYSSVKNKFSYKLLKINDIETFFSKLDENRRTYNFDVWSKDTELLLQYTSLIRQWSDKNIFSGYNQNINVGKIDSPGIYLLQVVNGKAIAYCPIVVTDKAIVFKKSNRKILAYVADAKTGKFIKNTKFKVLAGSSILFEQKSDNDGIVFKELRDTKLTNGVVQLFAFTDDETLVFNPYSYFDQSNAVKLTAYIYTNQPAYRPAQEVNFKAIMRKVSQNELENFSGKKVAVRIKSPKNKEVYSKELTTNEFGTFADKFILDEEADLGNYSIILHVDGIDYYGSFSVEEYKKPEYKVNIELNKNQYSAGDEINGVVSADYYFGSPVKNGNVQVNIYRERFWRPWWYFSEYRWFYRNFEKWSPYYGSGKELIQQIEGELNDAGKFKFNYSIENKIENDFKYSVVATVTDASRRATEGVVDFFVTRGSFIISTSPEKYFYSTDSEVKLRINCFDFNDKPVSTDFKVIITYPQDKLMRPGIISDTLFGRTNERGTSLVSFRPKGNLTGLFSYSVFASDENGREIYASSSFFIGNYKDYYYNRTSSGLEIVTDKDAYEKGEELNAVIFVPSKSQELLLTYESDDIFNYRKVVTNNNSFHIEEKLTDKFSPSFSISVSYINDRMLYSTSKLIGVLPKDKFLDIELLPSKQVFKPGEKASYRIKVKNYRGYPVKNTELSFGIVDESIYAIKEDQTQLIEKFFYSSRQSYFPVYNSLQSYRFSTNSREATFLEINYFNSDKPSQPVNYKSIKLYGKVTFEDTSIVFSDYKILLIGDKRKYESDIDSVGNYSIKDIREGKYQIYVARKRDGAMHLIQILTLVNDRKFDIIINESMIPEISEVLVIDERPMIEKSTTNATRLNKIVPDLTIQSEPDELLDKMKGEQKSDYLNAEIRSNFVDALIWKANLITDNNGIAEVQFEIPDNLTTWRTTVKGITKTSEVGQKVDKFISRKDLLVRMETPRFFRDGDEVIISTIVHNYLSKEKKTKIEFTADKLLILASKINSASYSSNFSGKKIYEVNIPANSELRIDWKCKVNYPLGEAKLKVEALTNEESDALELKVPILPNGIKIVNPLVANFSENKINETLEFVIPDNIDLLSAKVSFSVSPSLAGTILKALDDLAGYPYGCVEQTMSRFLPTVIVANTFREISFPLKSETIEELPKYVEAGLKRLYDYQHNDGGWGWWTNDNTNPYMTAYVIYGLTLAKQAGYNIDQNIYELGLRNLRKQIELADPKIDETTLAYMIYSLSYAMKDFDYQKKLYYQTIDVLLTRDLGSYPLALITIALNNFGEKEKASQTAERLIKLVTEEQGFAFWGGEAWHYRWQNDNVQGTAFAVKAIINVKGDSELISKAVRWLLKKKQGFSWRSTQETANVIFALTDYLKLTKELNPDYSVKVFVNEKEVFSGTFSKDDIYSEPQVISVNASEKLLKKGNNKIIIQKSGDGKVYFSGMNEYFTTDFNSLKKDNGFKVSREYFVLEPKHVDGKIIYVKEKFNGQITSGKEMFVKTYVETKSSEMEYFILEDMLPSGFEVVKDIDRYAIEGESYYPVYDDWGYRPWRWHYADREYRDEKVAFFVTSCSNKMEFSYIIKAQIPGEYKIMPAQGYLMYYPELNGYSEVVNIKVKDSQ
ncbi:Large extracellular alpha-helical protein [Ignavibacterium album JCM 16511]|uniref:Large extracellular alpha-helical protein n=1 Tax=Ignavibacterium album (strain DSM 19864 / JCM 16511 / NBRC 101810 / Mat9-16) TaxID=945713 RepID=I0AGX9_IGNAJ|nr:MG2 domain-containing protein [Ignavibacterium album]AFH48236.1 Large extracellular alpha-helical protein [Ignavibacterium album JCM 16511]